MFTTFGYSQQDLSARDRLFDNKEEVFIHYNSTFLVAGESLLYKLYSVDPNSGKLSNLSSIGYLELTSQDGEQIFLHKVSLKGGAGYGDFLIPSTVPSGAYKLLGYTRWMQNAGKGHFFSGDLVIINPYMEDQSNVIWLNDSVPGSNVTTLLQDPSGGNSIRKNKKFCLEVNNDVYGRREKVTINLSKVGSGPVRGNFSVSVKKLENFLIPQPLTAESFHSTLEDSNWERNKNLVLPDLRGEILSGKVIARDKNVEAGGRTLIVSLPGKPFFVRLVKTATDGSFKLNLDKMDFGSRAFFQVLGDDREHFEIILDNAPAVEKQDIRFQEVKITNGMVELIRQRSIYNQVENSYVSVKQDSIDSQVKSIPFYGSLPEIYNLDEFTRFPTLQETFVEIIQLARVRRNRRGSSHFELTGSAGSQSLKPLLIVDGLILQDHEDFIHYDAGKVKSIGLQREKYYLGPEVFNGLMVVETINGDFYEYINHNFIKTKRIEILQPKKTYYQPVYGLKKQLYSRVPDYRLQLLWLPLLVVDGTTAEIEFYTSDVPGNYEITIEGFTEDGEAVSLQKVIEVQ
ncbi:hypothetical protein DHB64_01510 [Antarcticibacterium sp. W02-3]|nr:hypothetical protein [Antarcticibacterium sp. W02-3]